jgi:hypothetical protein
MPLVTSAAASIEPTSPSQETLRETLEQHAPGVTWIDVRYRRGRRAGKSTPTGIGIRPEPGERQGEILFGLVLEAARTFQQQRPDLAEEPVVFSAVITVRVDDTGATRQLPAAVFRLAEPETDDDAGTEVRDEALSALRTLQGTVKMQDGLLSRQHQQLEKLVGIAVSSIEAASKARVVDVEVRRLDLEEERLRADAVARDNDSERQWSFLSQNAPRALALLGAKQAQAEARAAAKEGGTPLLASWRRLAALAKVLRDRDPLLVALGEEGCDLLDALASATTRREVEDVCGLFGDAVTAGRINPWQCLQHAPELRPFLDLLVPA